MNRKNIDIAIIQPPGWSCQNPPLGLALLKSYLAQKGLNAKVLDLNIVLYNLRHGLYANAWELANGYYTWERESYVRKMFSFYSVEILNFIYSVLSLSPKVIGFSAHNPSFISAKLLAFKVKQLSPKTKIIFGGPQVADYTNNWKDLLSSNYADAVIFGEGEESLAEYLKVEENVNNQPMQGISYRGVNGEIVTGGTRELILSLDSIPFADFSDFNLKLYAGKNVLPTYFSRGCINNCIYCTENKFFPKFRCRSGRRVYEEIVYQLSLYPNTRYFRMHDSVSNGNIKELEHFCELIIDNNINISFNLENAIIRKEMTANFYKKLKLAGCTLIGYGLENPSKPLLQAVGKRACLDADFDKAITEGAQAKIVIGINMMFGLPGEKDSDYQKQLDFLIKHRRNKKYILINPALNFCYFPEGCAVYREPEKYGIDMTFGQLYWSERNGRNTFLERLEKFEKFCALTNKLGYKIFFEIVNNINKHDMIGSYYYRQEKYDLAIKHFKKSFQEEVKILELVEDILKIYDRLSLKKDRMYEQLIKYKNKNSDCDSSFNAINSYKELADFIIKNSISDIRNRLNYFTNNFFHFKLSFSINGIKRFLKSIVSIFNNIDNKKYFIRSQIRILIDNKNKAMQRKDKVTARGASN